MKFTLRMSLFVNSPERPNAFITLERESDFVPRIGDTISLEEICYIDDNSLQGKVSLVEIKYDSEGERLYIFGGDVKVTQKELDLIKEDCSCFGWDFQQL